MDYLPRPFVPPVYHRRSPIYDTLATCPPFFDARVGEELRFARFIGIGIAAGNLLDANASSTTFTSAMKGQIETATSDNTVIVAST